MYYSCVAIILFNTDLCKSAYSTYSFKKLAFHFYVFNFFVCSVLLWIQYHLYSESGLFRNYLSRRKQPSEVLLGKRVLKICYKFTGKRSCWSVILDWNRTSYWNWTFPVSLLHILRTPFSKNTSKWLLLHVILIY